MTNIVPPIILRSLLKRTSEQTIKYQFNHQTHCNALSYRVSTFELGKDCDYFQQIIIRHCVAQWEAGGEKFVNCTKQDMTPRDVIKWAENNVDNDDVVLIMMNWIWSPNYEQNHFWTNVKMAVFL